MEWDQAALGALSAHGQKPRSIEDMPALRLHSIHAILRFYYANIGAVLD